MKSSIDQATGKRLFVVPADVSGPFTTWRRVIFVVLIALMLSIPFVRYDGRPLVFLNVPNRVFHFFFWTFNAQDFWLTFFPLSGMAFALFVATTLWGRVWCGYACPQTVFLEGVYRRVERVIEGPRNERLKRDQKPMGVAKLWRKVTKHFLFVVISVFIAHAFLAYFVSLPSLWQMVRSHPAQHPEAFGWMAAVSVILYGNFAFFREQLCLVICPYGRYQSVLTDKDTINVAYDYNRGEPRMKKKNQGGDCIDCGRCVQVCPTGIDIRNGLQLDCVGCAACIDACDTVMDKINKPKGLIRYAAKTELDPETEDSGWKNRFRLGLYSVLAVIGLVAAFFAFSSRTQMEVKVLRVGATPFVVTGDIVRNPLSLHVVNKTNEQKSINIRVEKRQGLGYKIPRTELTLEASESEKVPLFLEMQKGSEACGKVLHVFVQEAGEELARNDIEIRCPSR